MAYRAYIIPNASVGDKVKTIVMRTQFFAGVVLGSSPEAHVAYQVESKGGIRDWQKLFRLITATAEKSSPTQLEDNLEGFCREYDLEITKLIPKRA